MKAKHLLNVLVLAVTISCFTACAEEVALFYLTLNL